jgi:hypothetical protein
MKKNYIARLRKQGLKKAFTDIPVGDIRSFPLEDVNVSSFRARAGELNTAVGYTKFSVSVDTMTQTLRVRNNG